MNRYKFGDEHPAESTIIPAPSLEIAIKIFKVQELFPEEYVPRDQKNVGDYDSALGRYPTTLHPGAQISIYLEHVEEVPDPNWSGRTESHSTWELVDHIPAIECIDVDYTALMPTNLLPAPEVEEEAITVEDSSLPSKVTTKLAARRLNDELKRKSYEMEQQRREMQTQLSLLQDELSRKQRILYAMETYMGLEEEILQLQNGDPAPEDIPISVYQQKLYMDEEVGIIEDGGLDFKTIDAFDEWIIKHYKQFLYKVKSVCAWQVRRSDKDYRGEDPLVKFYMNEYNRMTYFLIRNGDKLYRIFSNVRTPDSLFPKADEMQKVYEEAAKWSSHPEYAKKKIESHTQQYLFSFVAIQGLIDRTDTFGYRLRNKVNLMVPGGFTPDQIDLIRDAEQENWIGDGRPPWRDFLRDNRILIGRGTRIIVTVGRYNWEKDWYERCYPQRPSDPPGGPNIYTVVDEEESTYGGKMLRIRYKPGGADVWDEEEMRFRERKASTPFRLYRDEVVNFDSLTSDDCHYYLHMRLYRKHYLELIPTLKWAMQAKKQEEAYEEPFVTLLLTKHGWEDVLANRAEIRTWVAWWKTKNKWKRALTKDEPKAFRMISAILEKQAPPYSSIT